jgi:hypothetical protein
VSREMMVRTADQHQLVFAKRDDLEPRPADRVSDDPEIDRAFETGLINLVRPAVFDADVDLRVRADELLDVGRQLVQPDAVDGRDADRPGPDFRLGAERLPASVSTTPRRRLRSINCWLNLRSSARTCWLTADCEMKLSAAAREKLPVSTRSQKVLSVLRCIWAVRSDISTADIQY